MRGKQYEKDLLLSVGKRLEQKPRQCSTLCVVKKAVAVMCHLAAGSVNYSLVLFC